MSIDEIRPDARAFLDLFNKTALAHLEQLTPEEARRVMEAVRAASPAISHNLGVVRDLEFTRSGIRVRLRLYDTLRDREPGPIIVYFHGGGFVLGDLDSHHSICVQITRAIGLPLVSVEYRLAPEHPWPAAPDDAEAAARWIAANAHGVLGRQVTSLVLVGDSAGGNLAAITARALRDEPARVPVAAQLLIYPTATVAAKTRSMQEFAEGLLLTKNGIDWFLRHYAAPAHHPRIDLFAFDQSGMPPTVLVTAGLDPLRDEGRAYAAALIQAGVVVIYQEAKGNIHGCFGLTAAIPSTRDDVRKAMDALDLLISS